MGIGIIRPFGTAARYDLQGKKISMDVAAVHQELSEKGAKVNVNDIQDDLFGPGSGVKFFQLEDPDGTPVTLY